MNKTYSKLGGSQAWFVWVLSTLFVVWLFNIQTGYGLIQQAIVEDTGMLLAQATLCASVYTFAFSIAQFFSGALIDRFGTRPLMAVAVALVTAGTFLMAFAGGFPMLAAAQIVMAVGASFGFVGTGYLGGKWFGGAKFGLMFGLLQMVCAIGSAVNQPFINWLLSLMSWRTMMTGYAVVGIALAVVALLFVRNPHTPEDEAVPDEPRRALVPAVLSDVKEGLTNTQVVLASLFAFMLMGAMLAMAIIWGPLVITASGSTAGAAALATGAAWIGMAVGSPAFQAIANRTGRKPAAIWGAVGQVIATTGLIFFPGTSVTAVLWMLLMGFTAASHMLGFTIGGESVPGRLIGTSAAIVNAACFIGGGIMMALPNWMGTDATNLGSLQHTLWVVPVLLVVGLLAALAVKETLVETTAPPAEAEETTPHGVEEKTGV
ncbi:MFS transporter (plasmid) [Streptomyces sp. BI20]|uniref:MFS transporter n=1 Tax=Streptomyces sp. BI20 TaxID=3403460 RepID=UPI003C75683A